MNLFIQYSFVYDLIVNPGVIDTAFHECLGFDRNSVEYAAIMDQYAEMHPMQRVGKTDDCVNAIAFLAHEQAAFITGAILPVEYCIDDL